MWPTRIPLRHLHDSHIPCVCLHVLPPPNTPTFTHTHIQTHTHTHSEVAYYPLSDAHPHSFQNSLLPTFRRTPTSLYLQQSNPVTMQLLLPLQTLGCQEGSFSKVRLLLCHCTKQPKQVCVCAYLLDATNNDLLLPLQTLGCQEGSF